MDASADPPAGSKASGPMLVIPDTPVENLPSKTPPPTVTKSTSVNSSDSELVHEKEDDSNSVHNMDTGNTVVFDDSTSKFPLFPNNVFYTQLSPGERITLAYKYSSIPQPAVPANTKKDVHEVALSEKDKLCTSFPVAPIVHKAFEDYTAMFEKSNFKSQPPSGNQASTPASNKYDFKPGFQVSPIVDKWELKIHDRAMPQVVSYDGNVESIQSNKKAGLPKNLKLTDGEWGNIQKASSFSLRGISHAAWFRDSAIGALDEALPILNPGVENEAACITKLHDVKQFLRGLDYTFDILARLSVYMHAGVTSSLRHEFLSQESKSMLTEEKMRLFTLPYGTSLVFQGQVHTVQPQVKEHRHEVNSSQALDNVIKLADSVAKISKVSSPAPTNNHNTRSARGGGGGSRHKTPFTPKHSKSSGSGHQSFPPKGDSRNRGSSDGGHRGRGRGKRGN